MLTEVAGWPALAELTASTGRARVADFLWEEVLSGVPAADRRLLAAVAAAGGADDAVASALAGRPVAVAALLAGLPLVSQAERGWYQLHALWQPALARELTPAEVDEVRRTAGRVLHERGDLAAAARLYADAGAWDEFDRLIVDTCQATYPPVGNDVLGEWLRRLPADRRAGPAALLLEATLLLITEPLAGQDLLRRAAEGFRAVGDLPGEIACLSTLALLVWWQQDLTAIGQMLPRVAELTATGGSLAGRLTRWRCCRCGSGLSTRM